MQYRRFLQWFLVALAVVGLGVLLGVLKTAPAPTPVASVGVADPDRPSGAGTGAAGIDPVSQGFQVPYQQRVGQDKKHDTTPSLRSMRPILPSEAPPAKNNKEVSAHDAEVGARIKGWAFIKDPVLQSFSPRIQAPTVITSFAGVSNVSGNCNCSPPDTNGEVGPNHYVEMVNSAFQIFNKNTGASLYGPVLIKTLWQGFGAPCEVTNNGDPVVLYDQLADRWVLTQFSVNGPSYGQCVAVSSSPDPLGSYYRYYFEDEAGIFPDYPKWGMWPDAYYYTTRRFSTTGPDFFGSGVIAVNRAAMLNGQTAAFQEFDTPCCYDRLWPADLDGVRLPPGGAAEYITGLDVVNSPSRGLFLWRFKVNWANANLSTFTGPTLIPTAPFNYMCYDPAIEMTNRDCLAQPSVAQKIDGRSGSGTTFFRYRNFGTYASLMTTHGVLGTSGSEGIRWYELRAPSNTTVPALYQQGTYSPDSINRFEAGLSMDASGNMALGYSVVSSTATIFPGVRYTGRLAGDPLGQMQAEAVLINGSGSQNGSNRWGDYSAMTVDPSDDCTFYYVQEYYAATGTNWQTRIGNFKFPSCVSPTPTATPTGNTPTRTATHTPTATPTITNTPDTPTVTSTPYTNITGSLVNGDATQVARLGRNGVQSVCGTQKADPGPLGTGNRLVDVYSFQNTTGTPQCVSVTLGTTACAAASQPIFSVAYMDAANPTTNANPFNPAVVGGPGSNYIADIGVTVDPSTLPSASYSFIVPTNGFYQVVVNTVNASTTCSQYSLFVNSGFAPATLTPTVSRTPLNTRTATATPTATSAPVNINWKNVVGVTATGNSIQKTAGTGWNAGASSNESISMGDVVMSSTVDSLTSYAMFGLNNGDANQTDTEIDYVWYTYASGNQLWIRENGINRGQFGTYALNDELAIKVNGGVVRYYKNENLLYTSLVAPTYPLNVDTSIYNTGGRVANVRLAGPSLSSPPTSTPTNTPTPLVVPSATVVWVNQVNVSASGNSITKSAGGASWNAGASSSTAIQTGNGYVEASVNTASSYAMVGLSKGDTTQNYTEIDYAWYVYGGTSLYIYENGANRGTFGSYTLGQVLRVEVSGTTVRYYANGVLMYTSTVAVTPGSYPLLVDASLYAGSVDNAVIGGNSVSLLAADARKAAKQLSFRDVPTSAPYASYLSGLAVRGLVSGYADGSFQPDAALTRGQMAKLVATGVGINSAIPPTQRTFTDVKVGSAYWTAVESLVNLGALKGYADGSFRPDAPATRGQMAELVAAAAGLQDKIPATRQTFKDVAPGSAAWLAVERLAAHKLLSGYADGSFRPAAGVTRGQMVLVAGRAFFPQLAPAPVGK